MKGKVLLLAAFLIVCFNLRTGFDSPDPLLGTIEKDMGLSLENSGLFALLPVFVLGVAAPISPRVARWMTPWKIIFWFQLLAVAGIFWRSWDGVAGLYGGMVLMGLGMGIAGAAIPGLIKHQFPDHASAMMGVYSAMIGVGSAVASGLSVPISNMLGGWRFGLGIWIIPILLGMLVWGAYFLRHPDGVFQNDPAASGRSCCAAARHGRLPFLFEPRWGCLFLYTWIPIFLRQRGMSYEDAGFILSVAMFAQLPATLSAHVLEKLWEGGASHRDGHGVGGPFLLGHPVSSAGLGSLDGYSVRPGDRNRVQPRDGSDGGTRPDSLRVNQAFRHVPGNRFYYGRPPEPAVHLLPASGRFLFAILPGLYIFLRARHDFRPHVRPAGIRVIFQGDINIKD
ncbi:MAG: CynX/NimT family MFS transporter [Akkermansia sp.]